MKDGIAHFFSPLELRRLSGLPVASRFTVEGAQLGAHRSHLRGQSLEFSDYRAYVAGDDLRRLDWRAFARSERLYLRQYEQECNLRVHLLVDASGSMAYGYPPRPGKHETAARIAAAVAYATVMQHDTAALGLFDAAVRDRIPAGGGAEHLRLLCNRLAANQPGKGTNIAQTLNQFAASIRRRALVVIISDLMDDIEKVRHALAHFRRRRHDVILYQVLDPAELEFPFEGDTAFTDLETGAQMTVNPRELRGAYLKRMEEFLFECRQACANLDVDYQLVRTDADLPALLHRHLARRR